MVKKFMLIWLLAFAQGDEGLVLEQWLKTAFQSADYPFSLIILESGFDDNDAPVVAKASKEEIEKISYFKLDEAKNLSWDININHSTISKSSALEMLELFTEAKYYLFAPLSGEAVFAKRNEKGKITKIFSMKTKERNWNALFGIVQKNLGWDGIVLATASNKFIVGAPAILLQQADIQALAIANSENEEILAKGKSTGAGLLSLVKRINSFGIFEAVFVGESDRIDTGTKLIIEKRNK